MAFKVSRNHWEIFVEFMKSHRDFEKGRVVGSTGKDTCRKLWAYLTIQLNAVGEGERSVQKWQKTWTDFKYALKRKAANIKIDLNATGGGPPIGRALNDFELRILKILGSTFYEGLGRPESGTTFMRTEVSAQDINPILPGPSHLSVVSSAASNEVNNMLMDIVEIDTQTPQDILQSKVQSTPGSTPKVLRPVTEENEAR